MRKLIFFLLAYICTVSSAYADWKADFAVTFEISNIDSAVVQALNVGITPSQIINEGLLLVNLHPQNLVKALYCAGADGGDITEASYSAGLSDITVISAYERSISECSDQTKDSQAYTVVNLNTQTFIKMNLNSTSTYASPSTFQ